MPKSKWIPLLAASFLITGLPSCKKDSPRPEPETHPAAPRKFSAPTVIRRNQTYSLVGWHENTSRELSLGESIGVGSPAPPFTEISGSCRQGSEAREFDLTLRDVTVIPAYTFVPEYFLARDLKASPLDCQITVKVSEDRRNRQGSNFRIKINDDYGNLELPGTRAGARGMTDLHAVSLLGKTIKLPSAGDWEAELSCDDLRFEKVKFTSDLNFTDFKLDHPQGRGDLRPDEIIADRPKQLCRVVVSDGTGVRHGLTPLFNFHFNKEKWSARYEKDPHVQYGSIKDLRGFVMAKFYIKNLDGDDRRLRFNRVHYRAQLAISTLTDPQGVLTQDFSDSIAYLQRLPQDTRAFREHDFFILKPNETAEFWFFFDIGRRTEVDCDDLRVRARFAEDIFLQELGANGDVTSSARLEVPGWQIKTMAIGAGIFEFDEAKSYPLDGKTCRIVEP